MLRVLCCMKLLWLHVLKIVGNLIRWLELVESLWAHFCCFRFSNLLWEVSFFKLSCWWIFVCLVLPGWSTYLSITSFHSLCHQVWSVLLDSTWLRWYHTTQCRWRLSTLIFRLMTVITMAITRFIIGFFSFFFMNYKLINSIHLCMMEVMGCFFSTINFSFCYWLPKLLVVLWFLPIW